MEGVVILLAGALLLTPGFVTDSVGFACLVPPWRRHVLGSLLARMSTRVREQHTGGGTIIEGEFTTSDDRDPPRTLRPPDRESR